MSDTQSRTAEEAWVETVTQSHMHPLAPDFGGYDFNLTDITHPLSLKVRFTGHCNRLYTVLDHSTHVHRLVAYAGGSFSDRLWALMHDAGEAFLPDVAAPIKPFVHFLVGGEYLPFKVVEGRILAAIMRRFDLPLTMPDIVHGADMVMVATEKRDIMGPDLEWKSLSNTAPSERIWLNDMEWRRSRQAVLREWEREFRNLMRGRG